MPRAKIYHTFFITCFVLLLFQVLRFLSPFLASILGAVVLTVLMYPLHQKIASRTWGNDNFHAALSTTLITLSIVVPIGVVGWLIFNESEAIVPSISSWQSSLKDWQQGESGSALRRFLGIGPRAFHYFVLQLAGEAFALVNQAGKVLAKNAALTLVHLGVMIFTLFFLLRDGKGMWSRFVRLVPMRIEHKTEITKRLHTMLIEVVRGSILTSLVQTVVATFGYLVVGVPAGITLGVLTGICSFLPVVGSSFIWGPVGISLILNGSTGKGLFIIGWGCFLVSVIDNLLRPFLMRSRTHLSMLFLFFGMMGGLALYGAKGVFLGPLLMVLVRVFTEIYQEQYFRQEGYCRLDA